MIAYVVQVVTGLQNKLSPNEVLVQFMPDVPPRRVTEGGRFPVCSARCEVISITPADFWQV